MSTKRGLVMGICLVLGAGLAGCGGGGGNVSPAASVSPAPRAGFTHSPDSPQAGQTVRFADASTSNPTDWSWVFGDGATSSTQNPTHVYAAGGTYTVTLSARNAAGSSTASQQVTVAASTPASAPWRFAMVGDTHVSASNTEIPSEIVQSMLADQPSLVLVAGDIVEAGAGVNAATMQTELQLFKQVMAPLTEAGIPVYPIRGNHENDTPDNLSAWNAVFSGTSALPSNGPTGETNLTYSFVKNNALFIGLDEYVNIHRVNQAWLDAQLAANAHPHVFVFGHEPAFKARHTDCLDNYPEERNAFWQSLASAGAKVYLCGHDHFFDVTRIDDGDGNPANDLYQCIVGTGGGTLFTPYSYNGDNAPYTPIAQAHDEANGYLLVELSGTGDQDLGATLTWKERKVDAATGAVSFVPTYSFSYTAASKQASYPIVDTGETDCYGDTATVIAPPAPDQPFYGQDPQIAGLQPSYRDNGDGTVSDLNTGLMWVKARGAKVSWADAVAGAPSCAVGGYTYWRMPTIKELYSLIQFTGAQGTSFTSTDGYVPFLDTRVFDFVYGSGSSSTTGDRVIDCQDWSGTSYVSTTMQGSATAFGVNFADGRIKGYPSGTGASGAPMKLSYVRYVRGNPSYGVNAFRDNGDGTLTDAATGLMWSQDDSGAGMDWQTALAWVQQKNAEHFLGHDDWRLPNTKELQSLVDYTRAPDAPDPSHQGPAIDPLFHCTAITNEGGALDYPFYWTGTNFKDGTPSGVAAAYVCFGRALGWMKFGASTSYTLADVHGAGAQRSDPKSGQVTDYLLGVDAHGNPVYGRGPQGDVVRIQNFVRLVRNAD